MSLDPIIDALSIIQAGEYSEQFEQAVSVLNNLLESPDCLTIAINILLSDVSDYHKIYALSLLKGQIPVVWGQISPELRLYIRNTLFSFFLSFHDNFNNVFDLLIDTIVEIALFEFPQEWEDLKATVFSEIPRNTDDVAAKSYRLVGTLIIGVDSFHKITPVRQQFLRNLFLDNIYFLYSYIEDCFNTKHAIKDGLDILNGVLSWGSYQQVEPALPFIGSICFNFIAFDNLRHSSLNCLQSVFLKRADFLSFAPFAALVLEAFGLPDTVQQNNQHITLDKEVITFLMDLLTKFLGTISRVFDSNYSSNEQTLKIVQLLESMSVPLDLLRNSILNIFSVIVSIRDPDILSDSYWSMWNVIFHSIRSEINCLVSSTPISNLISPLFNQIREAIYQCTPTDQRDQENNVLSSIRSRSAWSLLATIDPEGTINFLKEKPPSEALCYAIGNLDPSFRRKIDSSQLTSMVIEVFQYHSSSPEYTVSLLYCLSHYMGIASGDLFNQFFEYFLKCLSEEGPPISSAATNAIYYSTRRSKAAYMDEQIITTLVDQSESYLKFLEKDDAVRMFKVISNLSNQLNTEQQKESKYNTISATIIQILQEIFHIERIDIEKDQLNKVFECISESAISAELSCGYLMANLWSPLMNIATQLFHCPCPLILIEGITKALAQGLANSTNFNTEIFTSVIGLMGERPYIEDCFFSFFQIIRHKRDQINQYLPQIGQYFIVPVIQNILSPEQLQSYQLTQDTKQPRNIFGNNTSIGCIMAMLSEFKFQLFNFTWYLPLLILSIKSYAEYDNKEGIHCATTIISQLNQTNFIQMYSNFQEILTALFSSLTDMMHKESSVTFINFLRFLMSIANKLDHLDNNFLAILYHALQANIEEQQEGMFQNFLLCLKDAQSQGFKFAQIVSNFLILIRKVSPNDTNAFLKPKEEEDEDVY